MVLSVALTGSLAYFAASDAMRNNIEQVQESANRQLANTLNAEFSKDMQYLIYISEDPSFGRLILNSGTEGYIYNYADDIIRVHKFFTDYYTANHPKVDSFYLTATSGARLTLIKDYIFLSDGLDIDAWFKEYKQAGRDYYWLGPHRDSIFSTINDRQVLTMLKLVGTQTSSLRGVLVMNLNASYFANLMNKNDINANGYFILITPQGNLFSKDPSPDFQIQEDGIAKILEASKTQKAFQVQSIEGSKLLVSTINLENGFQLVSVVPEQEAMKRVTYLTSLILFAVVIMILLFSAVSFLLTNHFVKPIKELTKKVQKLQGGDFGVSFGPGGSYELGILADGLENMKNATLRLLGQVKEEQELKRRAEMKALQEQITPHFLYNTLTSIKHLVELGENSKASEMVSSLSGFFSVVLSQGRSIIAIREEIEHVKSYLDIMTMRYYHSFQYRIEMDEEVMDARIPKLVLQPIVENSIKHGLDNAKNGFEIIITGHREGDDVVLEIFDDGAGIGEVELEQISAKLRENSVPGMKASGGYGLRNVNGRLKLQFGPEYGLEVESSPEEYTVVRLKIKYVKYGE